MKKLETAANNTKSWKHKVAEHEGLLRLIEPGKFSSRFSSLSYLLRRCCRNTH